VNQAEDLKVRVSAIGDEADGVRSYVLSPAPGVTLPAWEPGAHVDVVLPSGLIRQYSLCSDPADRTGYRIGVLREPESRGGSIELHDTVSRGDELVIRGPRNHFALVDAPAYLFVAGGIGITPLLPMIAAARAAGRPWRLVYGGRRRAGMAFLDELTGDVQVVVEEESGMPDLAAEITAVAPGTAVYTCGPEGLLGAMEKLAAEHLPAGALHLERFGPVGDVEAIQEGDTAFEVELARTGTVLTVPADRTLLETVREVVPGMPSSCEEGYCGTCETGVLGGTPDHRDTVLDDGEKAANDVMMICVGRSLTPRITLDL
jgi:ferredoxin-NADP reductase